jgi:hypothetical protein
MNCRDEQPKILNRGDPPSRFGLCVERWRRGLSQLTGCPPHEIAERLDVLLQFCAERAVSPERMIEECHCAADRSERRMFYLSAAHNTKANLVVQSFLVHNGINVFGELVCMPNTVEGIVKEQGNQWVSKERQDQSRRPIRERQE